MVMSACITFLSQFSTGKNIFKEIIYHYPKPKIVQFVKEYSKYLEQLTKEKRTLYIFSKVLKNSKNS